MNGDDRLSKLYHDAGSEQPPTSIDDHIPAAARNATRTKPVPVTRNWMVPAALAAVLVLTVGLVTFTGRETSLYDEAARVSPATAPAVTPVEEKQETRAQQERLEFDRLKRAPAPAAAAPAKEQQGLDDIDRAEPAAKKPEAAQDASAAGRAGQLRPVFVDPEQWLDHIRDLKQQGRLDEARRSLAEFRLRYPDTKLPPDLEDF